MAAYHRVDDLCCGLTACTPFVSSFDTVDRVCDCIVSFVSEAVCWTGSAHRSLAECMEEVRHQSSPDCLHGPLPGPFLLSFSVIYFIFFLFFVSGPFARLSWPSRQLLSAR